MSRRCSRWRRQSAACNASHSGRSTPVTLAVARTHLCGGETLPLNSGISGPTDRRQRNAIDRRPCAAAGRNYAFSRGLYRYHQRWRSERERLRMLRHRQSTSSALLNDVVLRSSAREAAAPRRLRLRDRSPRATDAAQGDCALYANFSCQRCVYDSCSTSNTVHSGTVSETGLSLEEEIPLDSAPRSPNGFLSALSADDFELIRPHLRTVDLVRKACWSKSVKRSSALTCRTSA